VNEFLKEFLTFDMILADLYKYTSNNPQLKTTGDYLTLTKLIIWIFFSSNYRQIIYSATI